MDETEKPDKHKTLFTPTVICLIVLNVILLAMISAGLWIIMGFYQELLTAWLGKLFDL